MKRHTRTHTQAQVLSRDKRTWRYDLGRDGLKECLRPNGRSLVWFHFAGLVKGSNITGTEWEDENYSPGYPPYVVARPLAEAALRKAGIDFDALVWAPKAGPDEFGAGWFLEGAERGYNYWIAAPE